MKNIIIKDKNKNVIDTFDYIPKEILAYEKFVIDYKKFLNTQKIYYPAEKAGYGWCNHKNLRRSYSNGSWTQGGRYYAGYQAMSLDEEHRRKVHILDNYYRRNILINGRKVVEVDFESIHPNLLFHMSNKQLVGKIYNNIDVEKRWVKLWLLIALNANKLESALYAFQVQYIEEKTGFEEATVKSQKTTTLATLDREAYDLAHKIHTSLIKTHPLLKQYLCSGVGIKLQYHDSEIASEIMKVFFKGKVVCLPVHDSFIVEAQYESELKRIMVGVYEEYVKQTFGFENATINVETK